MLEGTSKERVCLFLYSMSVPNMSMARTWRLLAFGFLLPELLLADTTQILTLSLMGECGTWPKDQGASKTQTALGLRTSPAVCRDPYPHPLAG